MSNGPFLLRRLHQVGAADPKRIDTLTQDGILTPADLELALAEGRPSVDVPALRQFAGAIADQQDPPGLGRAHDILGPVLAELTRLDCGLEALIASGDVRRYVAQPRHLIAVGLSPDPSRVIAAAASLPAFADIVHRSRRRLIAVSQEHEIDLRVAPREEYGSLLFMTTGPADHVATVLRRRGRRLCSAEEEVYAHAGLHYVPPEMRDSAGVLDEAIAGQVPRLVTRADVRGDLHMHSTYSDGRDALREMVAECDRLGYEYIAITDHSEHASAFHTLNLESLARQREEIAALREQYPGMGILHGIEADILSDGSVDCPDEVMASLDIVLASLHEHGGDSRRKLTARVVKAIRHPLVSVITHPQNQIVGHRPPYDMDYDAIYEAAAETGTALEIDGAPAHLDLDGTRARAAVERGVTVTIDSDCHRARWLDRQMAFGLGTARRGRVEPRHVLNTRPLAEVQAFIARKRSGARS